MLWGGLLIIVGALLPLILVGRRSLQLAALATGIGVGLFGDEIGKSVTETNDYFFAPAAPLIYGAVLLLILLWLVVRRSQAEAPRDVLQDGVEALRVAVDGQLSTTERDGVVERLDGLRLAGPAREAGIAGALRGALAAPSVDESLRPPGWIERGEARSLWERAMPMRLERILILVGLAWSVFLGLVSSLVLLAAMDVGVLDKIPDPEGSVEVPSEPLWALLIFGIGLLVGVLCGAAFVLLLRGRASRGTAVAIVAMLTSLVAGGLLTFYVAQFGAVTSTLIHLALLGLTVDHRGWLSRSSA